MEKNIKEMIDANFEEIVDFRRELHQHPELSLKEFETTKRIAKKLDELQIPYRLTEPTGLIAEIKGEKPGKVVALRADIDALPIQELNSQLDYCSQNKGVMHACGHDTHTSMLFGAVKVLNEMKDQIKGTVRIIFQPAEEVGKGARLMVEQGAVEGVDNIFGIHIFSGGPSGTFGAAMGPAFAATDQFNVTFMGKSGHGGMPHLANDATIMLAQYITDLQAIVARKIDPHQPGVVTVGRVESGSAFNVISGKAHLEGTVRTFDQGTRKIIKETLKEYAEQIAGMNGGTVEFEYIEITEPVVNDAASVEIVKGIGDKKFKSGQFISLPATMGGEDFGYYLLETPGCFAVVCASDGSEDTSHPQHSERFNIDEKALLIGAELYAQYAIEFLESN